MELEEVYVVYDKDEPLLSVKGMYSTKEEAEKALEDLRMERVALGRKKKWKNPENFKFWYVVGTVEDFGDAVCYYCQRDY